MKIFYRSKYTQFLLRIALVGGVGIIILIVSAFGLTVGRRPPKAPSKEELFRGITYVRKVLTNPRPLIVHVVRIDYTAPGIQLFVTPGDPTGGREARALTTAEFLDKFHLQVAINGSFFSPFHSRRFTFYDYYPHSGDPVDIRGISISDGIRYSEAKENVAALCVTATHLSIFRNGSCPSGTSQALAGSHILVERGQVVTKRLDPQLHPRTGLAIDTQGQALWLFVVDGRQQGYSEGVSLQEFAAIIAEENVETAFNLDGGGSSTLVQAGRRGAQLLSSPIHTRIPMRQRPVGNHLGVYAQQLP